MKANVWLLITFVVCSWFAAIQCVCARTQAGIDSPGLPDAWNLFCDGRLLASNQSHSIAVRYPESNLANACVTNPPWLSLLRAAELPSDDTNQASDSQSDDKDMKLACLKPCLHAAEWRLNRPDAQRANSFINSKIKPPP